MTAHLNELINFVKEFQFYLFELVLKPEIAKTTAFFDKEDCDLSQLKSKVENFVENLSEKFFLNSEKKELLKRFWKTFQSVENFSNHCNDFERFGVFGNSMIEDLRNFEYGLLKIKIEFSESKHEFLQLFVTEKSGFSFVEK